MISPTGAKQKILSKNLYDFNNEDNINPLIKKLNITYNLATRRRDMDLSILIPARNEMFLARTIEDILTNIEADTEVIAVLDGAWADPPVPQHERVNVIYVPQSVGQRAATNIACRLSKAKYVMKCDAHCSFDKGFDIKMLEAFKTTGDNVTVVPTMRNLWAFSWKCYKCGWKKYQGPTPKKCDNCSDTQHLKRKMMWVGKEKPQSNSYCFDASPHFQYFNEYTKRPQYRKDLEVSGLTQSMSIQGSCWMLTREKYWELNICDENFGSWGSQGIEVAVKTWLSGGQVLVNHKTWYAHMFRTQGGDFSFPYPISGKDQEKAKTHAKNLFFNNKWDKQIRPFSWLVEKFWPVKGWTEEDLAKLKANQFEFTGSTETLPATGAIYFSEGKASSAVERGRPKKLFSNVTIIGFGWVGKSVQKLFPDAYIYDPPRGGKQRANQGEIAFICVPTPSQDEGKLDTSIVEGCVAWCQSPLIVIRSTVNPGTCDFLSKKYHKRIIMQPEYLGETAQHPLLDEKNAPFMIIGGAPEDRRTLINLYSKVYNANIKIRQVTAYEAEVIKLSENRAIAFKVAECQELYDVCEKAGLDYYTIRDAVYGDDPRFNLWWTFVYPDKRGFNSKCLPKDVYAWCAWAESLGYNPEITRSLLESNKKWVEVRQLKSASSQALLITDNEIPASEEDQPVNQETADSQDLIKVF